MLKVENIEKSQKKAVEMIKEIADDKCQEALDQHQELNRLKTSRLHQRGREG